MSTGIWHRLEHAVGRALHHHDREIGRAAIMAGFSHLKACVEALSAKVAELESENASLKAQPAGAADADLETLANSIEHTLGTSVADPEAHTG